MGCAEPGSRAWVSRQDKPTRKLKYTWEIAESAGTLVGVHTGRANLLAREAIEAGAIAELAGYARVRCEVRYGENSRIDLLLESEGRPPCYVEVKNVTLARRGVAAFPDAVTARGAKHLRELMACVAGGARAAMLFVVQRGDCRAFAPADEIDPMYGETLRRAAAQGVLILAYRARVSPRELSLERSLPVRLE
jgi:sugar fermentation stimulation protein A